MREKGSLKLRLGGVLVLCLPFLVACLSLDYVFPEPKSSQARKSEIIIDGSVVGISAPDEDADGVSDLKDDCSESEIGTLVNINGCEIETGVIEGLVFAPGDVKLSIEAKAVLDKILAGFLRYPELLLGVTSHTDNRGSAADNLALSKQRLNAVVSYMIASGIAAEKIQPFAYGESRPRALNGTLEGRERNRRIEINVIERLL